MLPVPLFLRRFIRKYMKPVPVYKALAAKEKFSYIYMFAAGNLLLFSGYQYYHRDANQIKDNSGRAWVQYLGIPNATVHKYTGFHKVSTEVITEEKAEI